MLKSPSPQRAARGRIFLPSPPSLSKHPEPSPKPSWCPAVPVLASFPTKSAAPSPHPPARPLLAPVAGPPSEPAAAWCFISLSPWQLAYSLTPRDPYLTTAINQPPACSLGRGRGSPLTPHTARPRCCPRSLPAGAAPRRQRARQSCSAPRLQPSGRL